MPTPSANDLLLSLQAAFPRQELTAATLTVYLEDLADLPVEALAVAASELRRTSDWFPTIKQIRERVAELVLVLPGEAEALAQVEARVAGGALPHPLVKEALALVGGAFAWKTTDEPGVIRGQFLRLYRELRAAQLLAHQCGRELPAPAAPVAQLESREQQEAPATPESRAADAARFRALAASIGRPVPEAG